VSCLQPMIERATPLAAGSKRNDAQGQDALSCECAFVCVCVMSDPYSHTCIPGATGSGKTWLFASYMADDERFDCWNLFDTRRVYSNQFRPAVEKMTRAWRPFFQCHPPPDIDVLTIYDRLNVMCVCLCGWVWGWVCVWGCVGGGVGGGVGGFGGVFGGGGGAGRCRCYP
jgi:hypothetical protein